MFFNILLCVVYDLFFSYIHIIFVDFSTDFKHIDIFHTITLRLNQPYIGNILAEC